MQMMNDPLRNIDPNDDRAGRPKVNLGSLSQPTHSEAATQRALVRQHERSFADEPHLVTEYAAEIIEHLLEREKTMHRDANYLANQPDVTERMRIILMDWLVDVHMKFRLHPETFYLAVDYVDRYLMVARGERATLQLVGVCAMLIAAKHEEIWPPEVKECVYISANTYTREQILVMEREIATVLNFRLCVPTPYPFMIRVLDCTDADQDTRHLASWCLDIATLDYNCLRWHPSTIGFAAVFIANFVKEATRRSVNGIQGLPSPLLARSADVCTVWTEAHEESSGIRVPNLDEVIACAESILTCAAAVNAPMSRYHAVKRKFSAEKYGEVAARYTLPATL